MTDYGTDINTPSGLDLDPWWATLGGAEAVLQVAVRRLVTARGSLEDDPSFGLDLRVYVNDHRASPQAIAAQVEAQLLLDERVLRAAAVVTRAADGALTCSIRLALASGTFRLVLDVSAVSVSVLTTEAA